MPFLPLIILSGVIFLWIMASASTGSRAALVCYFALVVFITDAAFRQRALDGPVDWQSALKLAVWLCAGLIGYFQMRPLRDVLGWPPAAWLLAYVVVWLISSVYSPTPAYTLGYGVALLSLYAFASALVRKLSEAEILWALVVTSSAFLLIGLIAYYELPELGAYQEVTSGGVVLRFSGISGHPNLVGVLSTIQLGAIFLLWYARQCRTAVAISLAAIGFVTLIASDSRTALIELVLASASVLLRGSPLVLGGVLLATGLGLFVDFGSSFHMELGQFSRSGDPDEVLSLTGRVAIWEFSLQKILESPIVGWGGNSSLVLLTQHQLVGSTHNALLSMLLSVGLIGTLPIMVVLVRLGIDFVRRPAPFRDFFFVASLVSGLTESYVLGAVPTVATLMFFLTALWPAEVGQETSLGSGRS
jgi:O-antigen ligase